MMLDARKVFEVIDEYEKDLFNQHIDAVLGKDSDKSTVITAAKIIAVREIRDRLTVPEIKA